MWAAYTAAEVLSFAFFLVMMLTKRRQLKKQGRDVDLLLLDPKPKASTFVYGPGDEYSRFAGYVLEQLKEKEVPDSFLQDGEAYLKALAPCAAARSRGCVEVVWDGRGRLIIRDNLDHTKAHESPARAVTGQNRAEYGPVLGWNRINLE